MAARRLLRDQDGMALTEYLLLLGLLVAGVVGGATQFGGGVASVLDSWSEFLPRLAVTVGADRQDGTPLPGDTTTDIAAVTPDTTGTQAPPPQDSARQPACATGHVRSGGNGCRPLR